jgi:hypothetical protein
MTPSGVEPETVKECNNMKECVGEAEFKVDYTSPPLKMIVFPDL